MRRKWLFLCAVALVSTLFLGNRSGHNEVRAERPEKVAAAQPPKAPPMGPPAEKPEDPPIIKRDTVPPGDHAPKAPPGPFDDDVEAILPPKAPGAPKTGRNRASLTKNKWEVKGRLYSPNDAIINAAADARSLAGVGKTEEMKYIRYLTVYNYPTTMRDDVIRLASFTVNSLSREEHIVRPAIGGPDNIIIRINLTDYGIDPKDWDKLGDDLAEPYFTQTLVKQENKVEVQEFEEVQEKKLVQKIGPQGERYINRDGSPYMIEQVVTVKKPVVRLQQGSPKKERAPGVWSDAKSRADLVQLLQTRYPIYRADWFIVNALTSPNYEKLLRIKTLDDFEELVLHDRRFARFEIQATITRSGSWGLATPVAKNNRLLARRKHANGYWWETGDFGTSTGAQNVIANFLKLGLNLRKQSEAQEFISSGLNGLQFYALTANSVSQDKLVDFGATKFVSDANFLDHEVRNARSCIYCHAKGIQPFKSQFQLNVQSPTEFFNFDKDPKKALEEKLRIDRVFGKPVWDDYIRDDSELYRRAIIKATTLEPEVNAQVFKTLYDGYQDTDLDVARVVYEVGLPLDTIKKLCAVRVDGVNNGVLLQMLAPKTILIRRDHWEEAFQDLAKVTTIVVK